MTTWAELGVALAIAGASTNPGPLSDYLMLIAVAISVAVALRAYNSTSRNEQLAHSANRLSDAYDLFTCEWKDKKLTPPIVFYRRYNDATGLDVVLNEQIGKREYEVQEARRRFEIQTAASRPARVPLNAGERLTAIPLAAGATPGDDGDRIERLQLETRLTIRQQIRRRYGLSRIGTWDDANDLGPVLIGQHTEAPRFEELRENLETLWRQAQIRGRWEKDATYILSLGLQDLGAYVRVGAVPVNHVCINGARLIIEEWVYSMSRVYGDFRRGQGNIALHIEPHDRFIGAPRRHAEWLACVAAIYWSRVYRKGYANYFILEFEAELARQQAVREALQKNSADVDGARAAGIAARDRTFAQTQRRPNSFLDGVHDIRHICAREAVLRAVDKDALEPAVYETVEDEINAVLKGHCPPPSSKNTRRAP